MDVGRAKACGPPLKATLPRTLIPSCRLSGARRGAQTHRMPYAEYEGSMQVTLPDKLVARLEAAAQAEGKTLEQWLGDKVEGRVSGYTEEDSPRVVKEWRREQRGS